MAIYDKPVRMLMKGMADAFALQPGQQFTKQQAIEWFAEHYPKVKIGTITAHLVRLSTNAQSRLHYNAKPNEDDLFFQVDGGHFRLYNPTHDPAPIHSAEEELTTVEEDLEPQGSAACFGDLPCRRCQDEARSILPPLLAWQALFPFTASQSTFL